MPEDKLPNEDSKNDNVPPDISHLLEKIDSESEKRKQAESDLKQISENLKNEVPEHFQDLIPDLPPVTQIKFIQNAKAKGLFNKKNNESLDSKRPNTKQPNDFSNLSPHQMMSKGYQS